MNSPAFSMDPGWLPCHPSPSRPAFRLSPGTVDAHCHVCGPGHRNLRSHMPDDGALVDFIPRIAPVEHLRRRLRIDNPARLYWGDTA